MRLKKAFRMASLFLSIFLLVGLFAGCEEKDVESTETTTTEEAAQTTEAETTGKKEDTDPFGKYDPVITINTVKAVGDETRFEPGNPERESLEENVWAKAYEEKLGIKLNYIWTTTPDQFENKWNLSIASRDLPDMGTAHLNTFVLLAEADMLEDVGGVYEKYASDMYKKAVEDDHGIQKDYATYNGKLLGLPITGTQPDNGPLLFIRKDWLDNVDMEVPETMEEFYNVAKAFRENDPDRDGKKDTWGFAASNYLDAPALCDFVGFFNGYHAYVNTWVEKDGKLVWGNVQPEARDALLMLQKMYAEDIIAKDFAVKTCWQVADTIVSEEVGMLYGVNWVPIFKVIETIKGNPDAEWIVAPKLPSIDDKPAKMQANIANPSPFVVMKGYEYPEAAVKLTNLSLELFVNEPLTYATQEDNFSVHAYMISPIYPPWKNLKVYLHIKEALETGDMSALTTKEEESQYEIVKKAMAGDREQYGYNLIFGKNSTYAVINNYLNNDLLMVNQYRTIPTETMNEKMGVLKALTDEVYLKIIMGDSIDTFDKMVQDWNKQGGAIITEEANEWYQSNK